MQDACHMKCIITYRLAYSIYKSIACANTHASKTHSQGFMPVQTRDDKSLRFGVKSQQQFYLCDNINKKLRIKKDKKLSLCHRNLSRKHDAKIQTCLHLCDDRDEQCRIELFWKLRDSAAAKTIRCSVFYMTALPRTKNDWSPVKCILSHFGAKCVRALVSSCVLFWSSGVWCKL